MKHALTKHIFFRTLVVLYTLGKEGQVCMRAYTPIIPVSVLPLDGILVHHRPTPSSKFAGTHLSTWVERGTMRVKCLAQEHNAVPRPGLEPGPPDPESSALTIRPPRLPQDTCNITQNQNNSGLLSTL